MGLNNTLQKHVRRFDYTKAYQKNARPNKKYFIAFIFESLALTLVQSIIETSQSG